MANNENDVKVKKEKKPNIFVRAGRRIARWFREMRSELKKVVWPTPKQTAKNSAIALAIIIASALVIWAFDTVAALGVDALIHL